MPSNPKPARAQLRPGVDFDQRVIPVTRQPQRIWFRVHKAGSAAVLTTDFPVVAEITGRKVLRAMGTLSCAMASD